MRESSQQGLQHAFDRFSVVCDQEGTKIRSKKIEVLCLLRRPRQCFLQVIGNTLQQVEAFKYLEVVFTSNGSRNKLIDTLICKANPVLRVLYCSVVTKRQLSKMQNFQFSIGSLFRSHQWSWYLGDDWNNTVKRTNVRDGMFAKGSPCDTSWQRTQVWNRKAPDVKRLLRIERSQIC